MSPKEKLPTVENLSRELDKLVDAVVDEGHVPTDAQLALILAYPIFLHFFGREWLEEHAFERLPRFAPARGYPAEHWAQVRATMTAETLYNLQHLPGFDDRVRSWRRAPEVESFAVELLCMKQAVWAGIDIRLRPETGRRGEDFDAELWLDGRQIAAAEFKAKVSETEVSEATVFNTLERAAKQCPSDRAAVVALHVPSSWTVVSPAPVFGAIEHFHRGRRRVLGVLVHWEARGPTAPNGLTEFAYAMREVRNSSCRFAGPELDELWRRLRTPPKRPVSWVHLPDLARESMLRLLARRAGYTST